MTVFARVAPSLNLPFRGTRTHPWQFAIGRHEQGGDPRRQLEAAGPSAMERLWAFIDAHVALDEHADPSAVAAWVTIGAEAVCQPAVRAPYATALGNRIRELTRLFSALLRERGQSTRGARDMAAAVASTIEGSFQIQSVSPEALPRGFASRALRRMVLGLLDAER